MQLMFCEEPTMHGPLDAAPAKQIEESR